ncbi:CHAT domain-containing protein [Pseudorhodoferax sp. Leaf267]|uniref:CHAT domain-containing tetratricopeptide repeat protein n=1 Tax=Pseudorhodoferax sp. Leaf267 TaxID=1736316 RepID=UPI0006F97D39|nr:CHAT domain-containing protein [Pseudorhodoferax sp. Leaf267]KQP22137.1 hypothetical protein ASF43_25245 [Pseudorhodoferax sp. Leaf267]
MKNRFELGRALLHLARWALRLSALAVLTVPDRALPNPVDPPQASMLSRQLTIHLDFGEYAQALLKAKQLLAVREAQLGPDHALTARSMSTLAEVYLELGQDEEAIPLYERGIGILEKEGGADSQSMGVWSSNLGEIYVRKGLYDNALPLYEKALGIAERTGTTDALSLSTALHNLGGLYRLMGRYKQALPLLQRALELSEAEEGSEHHSTGASLSALGTLYSNMGRFQDALPLFQRSLAVTERTRGAEHLSTGTAADNLGNLLQQMGEYEQALGLLTRALAISEKAGGPEHPATAQALNHLANNYRSMGRHDQALALYQRAVMIAEKTLGASHPDMSSLLGNLAGVHQDMGHYRQALELHQRSLAISVNALGPEHPSTATRMNNLGLMYQEMGRFERAMPLYLRAMTVSEKVNGTDHPRTATYLNNLAHLYREMDSDERAVPLYMRAIAISELKLGPDHPTTGLRLNNLGTLHLKRGRAKLALPMIQRALAIQEKAHGSEHPAVIDPLTSLAFFYGVTGRLEAALPLLQRALAVSKKALGSGHQSTGVKLSQLGSLYRDMGRSEQALEAFHEALLVADATADPRLFRLVYEGLMRLHGRQGDKEYQTSLAIWYGKQAVNLIQDVRGQLQGMRRDLQDNFLSANQRAYQTLANLLIEEGRIAEAEQVLAMLKENELFELTRSSGGQPGRREADYVGREREALAESRRLAAQAVRDAAELSLLDKRAKSDQPLTAAERVRQLSLLKVAETSRAEYQRFLAQLGQSFAEAARRPVLKEADSQVTRLRSQVAQDGDGAVGLHYSVAEDRVGIIVSTARGSFGRFSNVGRKALTNQVVALRKAVLARADTQAPAQALWKMLIEPVQDDIQAAGARTLVVSFSDELRYLPLAALQNPAGRYLVEDYALALWASAADTRAAPSATPWNVSAMGLTQARQGFPALPGVLQELNGIVRSGSETVRGRSGVLPGSIVLDAQFSRQAFESALTGRSNVVHVASHFDFKPGDESRSVLLLGEGEPLSLGQLAVLDFGRVEQLTLSACDTATGGGINENGAEVEGLAAVVLRQRAQSVLATLWKVADDSTARLMHDFYAARGVQNPLSRAQALRQAQLQMLHGPELGAGTSWQHPYYWAPFVLSGNWL